MSILSYFSCFDFCNTSIFIAMLSLKSRNCWFFFLSSCLKFKRHSSHLEYCTVPYFFNLCSLVLLNMIIKKCAVNNSNVIRFIHAGRKLPLMIISNNTITYLQASYCTINTCIFLTCSNRRIMYWRTNKFTHVRISTYSWVLVYKLKKKLVVKQFS